MRSAYSYYEFRIIRKPKFSLQTFKLGWCFISIHICVFHEAKHTHIKKNKNPQNQFGDSKSLLALRFSQKIFTDYFYLGIKNLFFIVEPYSFCGKTPCFFITFAEVIFKLLCFPMIPIFICEVGS